MSRAGSLDAQSAADRLGVSRATLYAYVSRGLIRAEPDPAGQHRSLYNSADIEALAARKARGRKPEAIAGGALDFGVPVLATRITAIEAGRLTYRGSDATLLARSASLEATACLLWGCGPADPFDRPAPAVDPAWPDLMAALARLSLFERAAALLPLVQGASALTWQRDATRLWPAGADLVRAMTAIACGALPTDEPVHQRLGRHWALDAPGAELVRTALVLLADHELNASTFAVRVVASTGASLAAALAAGLGALSGPLHGGQTSLVEALFDEAERSGDAESVIDQRLWRGDALPGFGHPLYPEGDPRAAALLDLLPPDAVRKGLLAAMDRLGKLPNVDFATVSLRRCLGLPRGSALSLFAIGRATGWIAHALEQQGEGRLIRPRARYVGTAQP